MYGIYSSYSYRDGTDAAITLADFLGTKQVPRVNWLSPTPPTAGLDGYWDGVVLNEERNNFKDWVRQRKQIVWFHVDKERLEIARAAKCRNILAVMWHNLRKVDFKTLFQYDLIVVPGTTEQKWLEKAVPGINTMVVPWSTMLEIRRRGRQSSRTRVMVHIRNFTAKTCGALLLHSLNAAMDGNSNLDLTIVHGRNFDAVGDKFLADMLSKRSDRVKELVRPSRQQRLAVTEQHDWTFWTAIAESAGVIGMESLACGTPVIGFDVPPVSTIVRPTKTGWLIPCDIRDSETGAPIAVPSVKDIIDEFREVCVSRDLLDDLRGQPWDGLESIHRRFQDGWSEILRL